MTLLDSNAIIYLSKDMVSFDDIFANDTKHCISIITYMEVLGYEFSSSEEEEFIKKLFSYLEIIYIDEKIAKTTISLRKLHKIKLPDAIICASCIVNNSTLITNDKRLKSIKNLHLELLKV